MNELIQKAIRSMFPKNDPINTEPTPKQLGIREQHFDNEQDYRLCLTRGRYGFRNVFPDGTRTWTVIY